MERDELLALRENLLALEVPEVGRKGAFYLSSAAALCLSAADYIQTERLSETNFVSAQDLAHAKSINSLWSWEVRAPEQALCQNRAASSLPVLLGHLGDPVRQYHACQAFSSLFPDMTLCMNPPPPTIHRVAGVSHYLPHRDDSVTGVLCRKWERLPALRPWPLLSREGVASVIR